MAQGTSPASDNSSLGPEQNAFETPRHVQIGTQPLGRRTQRDTYPTTDGLIGRNIEIAFRRENAGAENDVPVTVLPVRNSHVASEFLELGRSALTASASDLQRTYKIDAVQIPFLNKETGLQSRPVQKSINTAGERREAYIAAGTA